MMLTNTELILFGKSYCEYGRRQFFMEVQHEWDEIQNVGDLIQSILI